MMRFQAFFLHVASNRELVHYFHNYCQQHTVIIIIINCVRFFFKKRCAVCCSSRTDARVHGINSTFHVDVKQEYDASSVSEAEKYEMIAFFNDNLKIQRASIRINDIEKVDKNTFMAHRNVESRTYLYRLAITPKTNPGDIAIPIEVIDRCFFIE